MLTNTVTRQNGDSCVPRMTVEVGYFFSNNPEDVPSSFCLTRITVKGPCIVIRVAFLGGTPGHIRHEVCKVLLCYLVTASS